MLCVGLLRGRMAVVGYVEREDCRPAPEFTDEMFDRATLKIGGQVVRRRRPKLDVPKARIGLRLDQDVIDAFKAGGPGWQSRMNDAPRVRG